MPDATWLDQLVTRGLIGGILAFLLLPSSSAGLVALPPIQALEAFEST